MYFEKKKMKKKYDKKNPILYADKQKCKNYKNS